MKIAPFHGRSTVGTIDSTQITGAILLNQLSAGGASQMLAGRTDTGVLEFGTMAGAITVSYNNAGTITATLATVELNKITTGSANQILIARTDTGVLEYGTVGTDVAFSYNNAGVITATVSSYSGANGTLAIAKLVAGGASQMLVARTDTGILEYGTFAGAITTSYNNAGTITATLATVALNKITAGGASQVLVGRTDTGVLEYGTVGGAITISYNNAGSITATLATVALSSITVGGASQMLVGRTDTGILEYGTMSGDITVSYNNAGTITATLATVGVAKGGTGLTSATAYAVLCGGTTSTDAFQSIASVGTTGQVLTSNGASALPTFQNVYSLLFAATADATVTNTVTETSIVGSGTGSLTLPANFFTAGRTVRVLVRGKYSDAAVPGTLTIKVKLGSTVILTTGAQTPTGTLTNEGFSVTGLITCRTTGATGTVYGQGDTVTHSAATTHAEWEMTNTGTQTVDTTGTLAVDVTATWGTADASNSITGTNALVEALG